MAYIGTGRRGHGPVWVRGARGRRGRGGAGGRGLVGQRGRKRAERRREGGKETRGGRFHSRLTCSHLQNTFSRGIARGVGGGGSGVRTPQSREKGGVRGVRCEGRRREAPKVCQNGPNCKFYRASRDYNLRDHTKFADRSIKTHIFFALRAILSLRTLLKACIRAQVTNSMAKSVHNHKGPLSEFSGTASGGKVGRGRQNI